MAILRETRAKIDPELLSAMKDRLSSAMAPKPEKAIPPESEPVDRQKIAQIVLQYMKNRENGSRH